MTSEQKEWYLKHKGLRCPYCNNDDLTVGTFDLCDKGIVRNVTCYHCDRTWVDVYALVDVTDVEDLR